MIRCFLLLHITIWYFTLITEVKSLENALVFDPVNRKLEELNDDFKICPSVCLLACPANGQEQSLIDEESVSGNGLYMRLIQNTINSQVANKVQLENELRICQEKYKPVIVQDKETKSYETGYELYYENGRIELKGEKYEKFEKFTTDGTGDTESQEDSEENFVSKTEENGNTIFQVPKISEIKWVFYWISVLSIQISGQKRQINFTKDQINKHHQLYRTMFMCEDYSMEDDYNSMPSLKWLRYHKQSTLNPKDASVEENIENSVNSNIEENSNEVETWLEETQITPMRYFHTLSARMATCTYLNIAYVIKCIEVERLEAIDLYLYSMYRAWPSQIDIVFGVAGVSKEIPPEVLQMRDNQKSKRLKKFPIPIPGIVYRIVEYNVNEEMYNAIVIIHNNFYESVSNEERICPPESELKGWSDLGQGRVYQGQNHISGLTYTCPLTSEIIQQLTIMYKKTSAGSFDLNEDQRNEILKQKQSATMKTNRGRLDMRSFS